MTWYEPTYGYFPDEIADELGLDALPAEEIGPDTRPLAVYAGVFRPDAPAVPPTPAPPARALATIERQ